MCLAADANAFCAGDDDRSAAAQNSGGKVGCAKINADDSHDILLVYYSSYLCNYLFIILIINVKNFAKHQAPSSSSNATAALLPARASD
jgi:hypothetical protein